MQIYRKKTFIFKGQIDITLPITPYTIFIALTETPKHGATNCSFRQSQDIQKKNLQNNTVPIQ